MCNINNNITFINSKYSILLELMKTGIFERRPRECSNGEIVFM